MWHYIFLQCLSLQDIADLITQPRLITLWLQLDTWTEGWWYQLGMIKIICHCCCYFSGEAGACSNSAGTVVDTPAHLSFHWVKEFSSFLLYQPMSSISEVFPARLWPSQYHYGSPKRLRLFLLACSSLGGHVWVQTSRWASCFPSLSSFTLNANLHLNGGPRVHSIGIYSIRAAVSVLLIEFWWWLTAKT